MPRDVKVSRGRDTLAERNPDCCIKTAIPNGLLVIGSSHLSSQRKRGHTKSAEEVLREVLLRNFFEGGSAGAVVDQHSHSRAHHVFSYRSMRRTEHEV